MKKIRKIILQNLKLIRIGTDKLMSKFLTLLMACGVNSMYDFQVDKMKVFISVAIGSKTQSHIKKVLRLKIWNL